MDKAQIRRQINALQKTKTEYMRDLEKLKKALVKAGEIASDLNGASSKLSSVISSLNSSFTINGKTGDGGKLEKCKSTLSSDMKSLDSIKNSIQQEINKLNNRIRNVESQIRSLERQYSQME